MVFYFFFIAFFAYIFIDFPAFRLSFFEVKTAVPCHQRPFFLQDVVDALGIENMLSPKKYDAVKVTILYLVAGVDCGLLNP